MSFWAKMASEQPLLQNGPCKRCLLCTPSVGFPSLEVSEPS